jgi:hypothetical protein
MAALGDGLMIRKPGQDTEHLWVLVTKPDPKTGELIMVNVTTQRPHSDTTTILNVGDHPFIQRPSVVFYADARLANVTEIAAALARGVIRQHDPFTLPVHRRIQEGLLRSQFTPLKIKNAFRKAQNEDRA